MTIKYKSPTSKSSIHPHLNEVIGAGRASQALRITPFTISGKCSHYPINIRVQKDMSNKSSIYHKHMRNKEIYMCQI
ncbi:hypothetical protein BHE74_00050083 [Ensete ventricosum]|nr:hypothetical protein GW17_00053061 [Ensete ventricosum]RWW44183.1 hypothetical protein BHE74_00050083 [Ensete ventricosum]RZR86082.1 hypothetical protein BHM03_00013185 [Ensete ventricosum]